MRIDIGIWIGQDSDVASFLQTLETAAEDIMNPRWNPTDVGVLHPKFTVVLECEDMDDPDDAETAIELLEDAGFAVVESLAPAEKKVG
jgi:hypothetical protein